MRLWNEARVALYSKLQRGLPPRVRNWIGGSVLTAPLRRVLLRPTGIAQLVETPVDFHGRQFRFSAPVKEAWAVRRTGGIENGLCRLVLQECREGAVALDVGANYGFVSLVMARAVGRTGRVFAFEADRKIAKALGENVSRNGVDGQCMTVRGFVGDVDGEGRLSIDAFLAGHSITRLDFIKIDVDGPDLQVLLGARKTLERFHPVIVVEMTGDQAEIVAFLRELGYACTDASGKDVDPTNWPANVFAAVGRKLSVPPRNARL